MDEIVSIVIPVYNVQNYLRECINSVIFQTYSQLEIILVDDGSTDQSGSICDEYESKDNRIIAYHKKNGGLSDARNYGIERSHGKYLYLLDSDDYINRKTIEIMLHYMDKYNADLIAGGIQFISEEGKQLETDKEQIKCILKGKAVKDYFFNNYTNQIQLVIACNKLYKMETLKDVLHYPVGKIHEDEFVAHHLWSKVSTVVMLDKPLYKYRKRKDSITGEINQQIRIDAVEAMFDRVRYVSEYDIEYADHTIRRFAEVFYRSWKNRNMTQDSNYQNGLKMIYASYREVCRRIAKSKMSLKGRVIAGSLYISPVIYGFVIKYRELKRA